VPWDWCGAAARIRRVKNENHVLTITSPPHFTRKMFAEELRRYADLAEASGAPEDLLNELPELDVFKWHGAKA
jgi:hypothetical protein